ncbi:MAG: hypothetical protein A3I89_02445 [Candidatus Harrisonbacteria bacterium RIFCSPLOWO2_02_FULL_41_11]|uniref:Uncharacterized protein n=1 Tax=Candidatus Harrisonbacteria bacterium RIFCSPHIGHO2_02_FULL_42_16 TaxID=1798404 RepID=A0A1G1ZIU3_9BACT|nr:MAG: hypothetical protein A3B92_00160 [Candidatus Harrisonbacteria bacterium RIFCSPHIGHO2_02_FULL_42_16]OGY66525.1 MAG: hypothetical protein A3I89_02445 [Candidatus Harrisonbacteria bacterium RIFCSPLOWO2_02_FULL_41_11]
MQPTQKKDWWLEELPTHDCSNISVLLKNGDFCHAKYGWIRHDNERIHLTHAGFGDTEDQLLTAQFTEEIPIEEILLITLVKQVWGMTVFVRTKESV